ncbi:MAG: TraX family protein [Fastidiosipilaceae bacterium]|jgi:hypothetical protein
MKWIAIICMTLDHIASFFSELMPLELYYLFRIAGRFAFPIFAYSIVLGYKRTRSKTRYFLRLLVAAIATQLIFEWIFWNARISVIVNVLFTMAMGVALLFFYDNLRKAFKKKKLFRGVISIVGIATLVTCSIYFEPDFGIWGLVIILLFYIWHGQEPILGESFTDRNIHPKLRKTTFQQVWPYALSIFAVQNAYNIVDFITTPKITEYTWFNAGVRLMATLGAWGFPSMHHTRKPHKWEKYFFYVYYPAHFAIIMWIASQTFGPQF